MNWNGAVQTGRHRIAFYLIGQTAAKSPSTLACVRLADNAAALTLPQPALAVVGALGRTALPGPRDGPEGPSYANGTSAEMIKGELVVLAEDHLYGRAMTGEESASCSCPAIGRSISTGTSLVAR